MGVWCGLGSDLDKENGVWRGLFALIVEEADIVSCNLS